MAAKRVAAGPAPGSNQSFSVLVFSKTTPDSYRHESIPAGVASLHRLSSNAFLETPSFTATASEDSSIFAPDTLAQFRVIVFLQTAGDFLSATQLDALKGFVAAGGGIVGIHAATTGMPRRREGHTACGADADGWYRRLLGAEFADHPEPQWGQLTVVDSKHSIMRETVRLLGSDQNSSGPSPARWRWFDEWYNFTQDPRIVLGMRTQVLLSVTEDSYYGGTMGADHPIAWCHQSDGDGAGRVFYTALGHFDEAYQDERFMAHIHGGILWAAGLTP